MRMLNRTTAAVLAGVSALAISCSASYAAGDFEGNWQVKDTKGTPFQIELKDGGKASADREGEGMTGTWKESGDAAVINWSDGWTTKIAKAGDGYTKSAWKKGMSMDDKPTNTSDAVKK